MPSEKEISDGICVPCIRLRFILTKPIGSTFFVQTAKSVVGRILVSDDFPSSGKLFCDKRRIRESDLRLLRCFALGLENKIRPSEEMFQRCRSDTRIRHFPSSRKTCSANKRRIRESDLRLLRCFALGLENKIRPSEDVSRCGSDTSYPTFFRETCSATSVGF